ncbi:UDP-4-amino-4,6-dideoxy-N-acetyl-beta-L-altrosamine transaminase [Alteromonas oceanisediminis]|uniref:UDP-4-amino-4, 6-dideoxy-N-acetyl-beta-L-altrosamine transaminase n=1 Tax=Alteromonas oceanisediminis TaxID=2836180 RepID=UPI001BD9B8E3|nr:UDP-4-amino-4,6-dideoxy-N-acetyl-beta-L-altrosamine transaminase [Alteromonas oceanisediminis]MBT0584953.1 UDP-4-amino-4,6-dideoxy-N-acetyl-beta-L-altrosamine transaminase [Alteromonas oceanisediminis]
MIPYGKHSIDQSDIDAVVDVLQNKFLTQGETVPAFEKALCDYTGARYCTAVNSGTSGLHVACLAAGVGPGQTVWTVPNSFVASANCALYCGADVDFVDIDPLTRNLCIKDLADKLASAKQNGTLPNVLIVVHFAGASCDMRAISALIKPYDIVLIEDAAHGLGGRYEGSAIGSCQFSDMAVLSFHPVKSITTAEGGAVMTNHAAFAEKLVLYAKHGITRDQSKLTQHHGPWYYEQHVLGFNYRLSDLHAALGLAQLAKLDNFVARRETLAKRYHELISATPIAAKVQLPLLNSDNVESTRLTKSAWHLFMIEVLQPDRTAVYEKLVASGVGVNVHYIPIHWQPFYARRGFRRGQFPNAERFYQRAITLPLFPDMTFEQQDHVVEALQGALL